MSLVSGEGGGVFWLDYWLWLLYSGEFLEAGMQCSSCELVHSLQPTLHLDPNIKIHKS